MASTLARQGTSTGQPYSLARANQLNDQLEAGLGALAAPGVVTGATLTKTTGYSLSIAAGTFWAFGMLHTLAAPQAYTAAEASTTVYVWAKVARTPANQAVPTALDTYALSVTHNTTGTAPSSEHFLLGVLTTDGSGILTIENYPAGKYVRTAHAPLRPQRTTIPAGTLQVIASGEQAAIWGTLVIEGDLAIGGELRINE
jgi:hypothetical protein